MTTRLKIILLATMIILPTFVYAKKSNSAIVTATSIPSGAQVYVDGKLVGTTPCKVELFGKWIYDVLRDEVNPQKPPYSKKFIFVLDGYETATEYWEGAYKFSGKIYGIAYPKGYDVTAILKKDPNNAQVQTQPQQTSISTNEDLVMQCNIDSEPEGARIFWRIISQDSNIRSTEQQYLGKTPFIGEKAFKISGLSSKNANKIKIEVIIKKNGYYDVKKIYHMSELLGLMEINGFFEMEAKTEG